MKFVLHADGSETADGADVIVPWWSYTKTLIAALALTLVRDRLASLDEPLAGEPFSLRELLQHRAGLADYGALPAYHAAVAANRDAWPAAYLLSQTAPLHERVTRGAFCYSNVGYLLIRRHLERIMDRSLGDMLRERLFAPLGVHGPQLAERRDDLDAMRMGSLSSYDPRWVYHGLVVGTLRDAVLLLHRLLATDLLPQNLVTEMRTGMPVDDPGSDRPWLTAAYGLGTMTGTAHNGAHVIGHTGGGPGSGIAVYHFPATSITAAVFIGGEHSGETERETFALGKG
ncbi:class A beta-lactamase-related serine hydrolase [Tardiphaga alba]|uniref:Class A beta-lactamase-related serine hydrolase n=1 Tax=Tardiphaga alba TaxID=340268 RepID=A0ABX8A6N3_9BRAD|nr:serine hydrolase domain-containing protein [Tardiphaga alba]QUS38359.1 class A beta-lactamase-related serine hydrolase [Tardiphaga alba]